MLFLDTTLFLDTPRRVTNRTWKWCLGSWDSWFSFSQGCILRFHVKLLGCNVDFWVPRGSRCAVGEAKNSRAPPEVFKGFTPEVHSQEFAGICGMFFQKMKTINRYEIEKLTGSASQVWDFKINQKETDVRSSFKGVSFNGWDAAGFTSRAGYRYIFPVPNVSWDCLEFSMVLDSRAPKKKLADGVMGISQCSHLPKGSSWRCTNFCFDCYIVSVAFVSASVYKSYLWDFIISSFSKSSSKSLQSESCHDIVSQRQLHALRGSHGYRKWHIGRCFSYHN